MNLELSEVKQLSTDHCILFYCVKYKSERYEYSRKTYYLRQQNGQLMLDCMNNEMAYLITDLATAPSGLIKMQIRDDVLICKALVRINVSTGKIEAIAEIV